MRLDPLGRGVYNNQSSSSLQSTFLVTMYVTSIKRNAPGMMKDLYAARQRAYCT
jgi:hypothetical protein